MYMTQYVFTIIQSRKVSHGLTHLLEILVIGEENILEVEPIIEFMIFDPYQNNNQCIITISTGSLVYIRYLTLLGFHQSIITPGLC